VFGKKVVATHNWIQDGWEQGGLYCQRSCLLALLPTLEVAEKACKVWKKTTTTTTTTTKKQHFAIIFIHHEGLSCSALRNHCFLPHFSVSCL